MHVRMHMCACVWLCVCMFVCEIQQQIYLAVDKTWLGGHPFTDGCCYTFVMCYQLYEEFLFEHLTYFDD